VMVGDGFLLLSPIRTYTYTHIELIGKSVTNRHRSRIRHRRSAVRSSVRRRRLRPVGHPRQAVHRRGAPAELKDLVRAHKPFPLRALAEAVVPQGMIHANGFVATPEQPPVGRENP
jgi:hypothetical protein